MLRFLNTTLLLFVFSWNLCAEEPAGKRYAVVVGTGVSQNRNEAINWYHKAAAAGYEDAKKRLKELSIDP